MATTTPDTGPTRFADALHRANAAPRDDVELLRRHDLPQMQELVEYAGDALQHALDTGESLTADQRAEAATAIYVAKYLTTKVALDATSRLFEIQGARSTTSACGFDRTLGRRAPGFSLSRQSDR